MATTKGKVGRGVPQGDATGQAGTAAGVEEVMATAVESAEATTTIPWDGGSFGYVGTLAEACGEDMADYAVFTKIETTTLYRRGGRFFLATESQGGVPAKWRHVSFDELSTRRCGNWLRQAGEDIDGVEARVAELDRKDGVGE